MKTFIKTHRGDTRIGLLFHVLCAGTYTVSSSGGDTTVNVLTMAENTLGGALLFFHDMESDGVCSTDFHDCEVQVYVEKVENSVRGLSRSVKRGAYCISRNM